jgi:uncharacterized protein YndB with AHSA1/START domain
MEIDKGAPVWAEREVQIDAPIEVVWDVLANVDDWPRWLAEIRSAVIAGPVAPETTIRLKTRDPGTVKTSIGIVEQPHALALTSRKFGTSTSQVWRLDRGEGGTRVHAEGSMEGLPARLLSAPIRKKFGHFLEAWLRDMKAEAERRAS